MYIKNSESIDNQNDYQWNINNDINNEYKFSSRKVEKRGIIDDIGYAIGAIFGAGNDYDDDSGRNQVICFLVCDRDLSKRVYVIMRKILKGKKKGKNRETNIGRGVQ